MGETYVCVKCSLPRARCTCAEFIERRCAWCSDDHYTTGRPCRVRACARCGESPATDGKFCAGCVREFPASPRRPDWVVCIVGGPVGLVLRAARDGSWCDVDWRTHRKRMPSSALRVVTEIPFLDGTVCDVAREREFPAGARERIEP